ncbi:MAG: PilN domain-containing protein [Candidatus Sericytochromatia bacterium]
MSEINLEKEENQEPTEKKPRGKGVIINVNLLGYQAREELEKSSSGFKIGKSVIITVTLISLAILINIISYIFITNFRDEAAREKDKLTARKTELEAKTKELLTVTYERDLLKRKKDILSWATGNSLKWSSLLEEIRGRIPANLWVDKIDIADDGKVAITGVTFDHKTVAIFLANLQDSPSFSSVNLDYTKKNGTIKVNDVANPAMQPEEVDEKGQVINKNKPPTEEERFAKSETKFSIRANIVIPVNN